MRAIAKNYCDFYFPAVVQQDNVVIGVTSSGVQHKQAGRIAQRIDHIKTQLLEEGGSYHE